MWNYEYSDELMHYGVPGMKWGVRRAQKRAERADKQIRRLNTLRKNNKNVYDTMRKETTEKYANKKPGKLNRALARDKAAYDITEVTNKYAIARQKAKKDKTYKQTDEYKKAKKDFGKQTTSQYIYGTWGHQRIETLKNDGYSSRKAKGRAIAEEALMGVLAGVSMVGIYKLIDR